MSIIGDNFFRGLEADEITILLPNVAVITNPRGSLMLDEPSSKQMTFVFTRYGGSASVVLDSEKLELSADLNTIISGTCPFNHASFSADFKGHVMIMSQSFCNTIFTKNRLFLLRNFNSYIIARIPESDIEGYWHLYEWLKIVVKNNVSGVEEQLRMLLRSLFVLSFNCNDNIQQRTSSRNEQIAEEFLILLESSCIPNINEAYFAEKICVSLHPLCRAVKIVTGDTPASHIRRCRVNIAKEMVLSMSASSSMEAISDSLGFSSPAAFSRFFKSNVGKTPSEFRNERITLSREMRDSALDL